MTSRPRSRRPGRRPLLESPWLAAVLGLVVIGLGAVVLLPSLLAVVNPAPTPTLAAAATATPSPAAPTFLRPTPSPQPSFAIHVVASGDSLNSIARQFRTTARSIAWWNRGAHPSLDPESAAYEPNRLQLGWSLRVLPGIVVDDNDAPAP